MCEKSSIKPNLKLHRLYVRRQRPLQCVEICTLPRVVNNTRARVKCSNALFRPSDNCSQLFQFTVSLKGPITLCNFSCNFQRNSTLKRCKFVTNVWYVKNIVANCDGNLYLPILHLPRVEMHCKLQEKLHRVTGPSLKTLAVAYPFSKS